LGRIGIVPVRQEGSHIQLRGERDGVSYAVTVPANQRSIKAGTMKSILRQADLSREKLEQLIDQ
jgi:predicted RNA binding protein YcfA (HicA-like mRNA interferase family)